MCCVVGDGCSDVRGERVAGGNRSEPQVEAPSGGFHLSAEGPGIGARGRGGAEIVIEGRDPEAGAEGAAWGLAAGGGGSAFVKGVAVTAFFNLGAWTRLRASRLPNTTRASPICSSVPRIETWRSSRGPDINVYAETRAPEMSWSCLSPFPPCPITWAAVASGMATVTRCQSGFPS